MFKFENNTLPSVFKNYFISLAQIHFLNTRGSSKYIVSLMTALLVDIKASEFLILDCGTRSDDIKRENSLYTFI